MSDETITIRTKPELLEGIAKLANAMDRSRSWVIEAALKQYLDVQSWQVEGIQKALDELERGEIDEHTKVFAELRKKL